MVLGCPFGTSEAIQKFLREKIESLETMWLHLGSLRDNQVALTLLRVSLGVCRVNYLMRCLPPTLTKPAAAAFNARMKVILELLLETVLTIPQWAQAQLPIPMGGLGLAPSQQQAVFAYMSSLLVHLRDKHLEEGEIPLEDHDDLYDVLYQGLSFLPQGSLGTHVIPLDQWLRVKRIELTDEQSNWVQQKWWMNLIHVAN